MRAVLAETGGAAVDCSTDAVCDWASGCASTGIAAAASSGFARPAASVAGISGSERRTAGPSGWPIATAAIAGRSLSARRGRGLRAPAKTQLPRCSGFSRHRKLVSASVDGAGAAAAAPSVAMLGRDFAAPAKSFAGASAIDRMGSGSGAAMKTATPLAPAIKPRTVNASTVRKVRKRRLVGIYPNSGCRSQTGRTGNLLCSPARILS